LAILIEFPTCEVAVRRFLHLIYLGLLAVLLVTACNTITEEQPQHVQRISEDCRIVQHMMGESCVPQTPQRVVTLRLDHLANSLALGIQPIASAYIAGFPLPQYLEDEVVSVESVGSLDNPDLEKILSLKPDLIISNSRLSEIYPQLSYIAPTVVLDIPSPPPSWQQQLEALSAVYGKENVAKELINTYWKRIEELKNSFRGWSDSILVSIANSAQETGIWVYGEKHFSGLVLGDLGLNRPSTQQGDFFYINLSKEKIFEIDGDILFFVSWEREDDKRTLEKLKKDPLWKKLNAVKHDRVYFVGMHWHSSDIFAINAILDDIAEYLTPSLISQCDQLCAAAFSAPTKPTYLFTTSPTDETAPALLQFGDLYLNSTTGDILWKQFPAVSQSASIAKIPAIG
jgi:iron complex transport system substrate-binding protein